MIRENLRTNVVELVEDVRKNKNDISGVELIFDGDSFDFVINYHGVNFIREDEVKSVSLTEQVKYTIANNDIDYLTAIVEIEMEEMVEEA